MKSKMFKKLMAAVLATAMTASLAACTNGDNEGTSASGNPSGDPSSSTPSKSDQASEPSGDEDPGLDGWEGKVSVLKDKDGNVYDLGGMEIVIRDWFTSDTSEREPKNEFEEAQNDYWDWIQETYNFKIKRVAMSDWGSAPQDFVDYAQAPADENNYVFIVRSDAAVTSAVATGLCYDLSTLDCLDFSQPKFQLNKLHEKYRKGKAIYAMAAGAPEPRTGVFFNKRLLKEADIDPESIYDMQKAGTWTWDALLELMAKVQRDTDQDGQIDVWAANCNNGVFIDAAVYSNGGEYVGKDASGKYVYKLEDANTLEGLEFAQKIFNEYWEVEPADAQWDYYKNAFLAGEYVFLFDQAYLINQELLEMDDDYGFVMFPKGPKASDYTNLWDDNPVVIPANYDTDRVWKIAFAWNLFTNDIPGYEDSDSWKTAYLNNARDTRTVDETLAMMRTKGFVTYHGVIPDLDFTLLSWHIGPGTVVSETVASCADVWKANIEDANAK